LRPIGESGWPEKASPEICGKAVTTRKTQGLHLPQARAEIPKIFGARRDFATTANR
jgi:hypothetical protein